MKKRSFTLMALLLACIFVVGTIAGCAKQAPVEDEEPVVEETQAPEATDAEPEVEPEGPELVPAERALGRSYLEYEVIIPADGVGDHPAFAILTDAKEALASIGITLNINDPADSNVLWNALDAGEQDLWTAAWGSTIDPDMYQVYHSSNIVGLGGSDSNHYHVADAELDELIIAARKSDNQDYRKTVYKQCLDILMDWAVEIPNYQRQNCIVFSPERINMDTLTPDITTYWGWMNDLENLEMVNAGDPLVVAYDPFSSKFSPFYADTAYDQDVVSMTQLGMLTTDRMGGIIYNAIEGETVPYNGTDYLYTGPCDVKVAYDEATDITTYTIKMREDLKFSDGEPVTADDAIFTYYVYADPAYVGSTTLSSYKILGLQEYQLQLNEAGVAVLTGIYEAGEDHVWSADDPWTEEEQTAFWTIMKEEWVKDVQSIVDSVVANYAADYSEDYVGYTADEVTADEGLQVALGMACWGFGQVADGVLTGAVTGKTWNLAEAKPTVEDFYEECYQAYAGDPEAYWETEAADSDSVISAVQDRFAAEALTSGGDQAGVPNIEGIKKLDQYTIEVKSQGYEAPAVYTICGLQIAPLHYYGDAAQYDYDNNMFGHPFGDLSLVEAKTTEPMGAGPYKFVKFENKVVYFEANENYYKGAPKIASIQFKETASAEVAAGVQTGTVDAGELTGSITRFNEIRTYNSNGELTGDKVATSRVDNLGYGYIGLNADTINIAGEAGSEASKNLRKALATVLAVYREIANNSYYGDAASTINYPISNTSWAAPQSTDSDYAIAYSVDVNGNPIYTADMSQEDKEAAALQAALGFFEAAGFVVEDGKVVSGPMVEG